MEVSSFIFQNPAPDFEALGWYDIKPVWLNISEASKPIREGR
jgi:hypothetical protein